MKTGMALVLTGLVAAFVGSLAAQPPVEERNIPRARSVLYDGPLEVELIPSQNRSETLRGDGRVYEHWVVLDQRQMIPREQIRRVMLKGERQFEDFGDTPDATRDESPDRSPTDPPKRRPFRED